MTPSTTCSHGGIVEGLLCQCPAPGEHSGPYRWDGRGLVPGWDRTGTPAVPCDGHRPRAVSPACAGLPRSAVPVAPRPRSPLPVLPVPRTGAPCPCPRPWPPLLAGRLEGRAVPRPGSRKVRQLRGPAADGGSPAPGWRPGSRRLPCSPRLPCSRWLPPGGCPLRFAPASPTSYVIPLTSFSVSYASLRARHVLGFRSSAADPTAAGVRRGAAVLFVTRVPSYGERASTARSARVPALHPGECPRTRFPWSERWAGRVRWVPGGAGPGPGCGKRG